MPAEPLARLCEARVSALDALATWLRGGLVGSTARAVEEDPVHQPHVARVSFVAACTLGKLAHAEGAAATARAFCQAMAELEHWEAQEAAAYARQRRKGAASQAASRGTLGGAAPAADAGDLGRERQRREGVAPAPADLGSATGRAAASIFGAVSGTVSGLLSAGPRDAVFSGMFPQSSRLGRLDGATIQKPVLHRGPRGEVIYEWLAPGAPDGEDLSMEAAGAAACDAGVAAYRRVAVLDADESAVAVVLAADARLSRLILAPLVSAVAVSATRTAVAAAARDVGGGDSLL
ncbi:hypothetical protein FNF27_03093 [Cafeteria roenbergensis]|uniref:Uncharacterized protein n=2 Tax=Cafeteria roenbergensis TaxID=33653 RepID=A0A5A8EBT5_CAFRO|nr:hypothetical protein FNF27_03093 [Cafeteria roenbergensis]